MTRPRGSQTADASDGARRGRRPQTPEEAEAVLADIVEAATEVFAEVGFHRMTVEMVIQRVGIARPTFYRYFDSVGDVANAVFSTTDQSLLVTVLAAFELPGDLITRTKAAVEAYLDWARGRGSLLRAMYAELHDPTSPVSVHTDTLQHVLADAMKGQFRAAGRKVPSDFDVDLALNIVMFAGFRLNLSDDVTEDVRRHGAMTVLRTVTGLLQLS